MSNVSPTNRIPTCDFLLLCPIRFIALLVGLTITIRQHRGTNNDDVGQETTILRPLAVQLRLPSGRENRHERLPVFLRPHPAMGSVVHDAFHAQLVLVRAAEQVRVHRLHRERERVVCALAQARAGDEDELGLRLR